MNIFKILEKYGVYVLAAVVLAMHLFFVKADPSLNFDFSRGPFTDEGFYLAQLRNYLSGHGWGIENADALLKSPAFTALFFLPLKIVGAQLWVARLFVLLLSAFVWFYLLSKQELKLLWTVFLSIGMLQVYLFEYSHYVMPEILCCHTILAATYFFYRYTISARVHHLVFSALLFSITYWLKVQFLYILAMPVFLFVIYKLKNLLTGDLRNKATHFLVLVLTITVPLAVYYLWWYLPHEGFYKYVLLAENRGRIDAVEHMWQSIKFYYENLLLIPEMQFYTRTFSICLVAAFLLFVFTRPNRQIQFFVVAALVWVMLEIHKLTLFYVPLRYLIPLIYAAMLFCSGVLAAYLYWILRSNLPGAVRYAALFVVGCFICMIVAHHSTQIFDDFKSRRYTLNEVNTYLKNNLKSDKPIAGNWGASASWGMLNETLPVSHWIINDEKIFTSVHPAVIVTEQDETDSNGAYKKRGINLAEYSDSVRAFAIGKWQVQLWWIKPLEYK